MLSQFQKFITGSIFDAISSTPQPNSEKVKDPSCSDLWISDSQYEALISEGQIPTDIIYSGTIMKQNQKTESINDFFAELYQDRLVGFDSVQKNQFFGIIYLPSGNQYQKLLVQLVKIVFSDNQKPDEDELLFFFMHSQKKSEILFCENTKQFQVWLSYLSPLCILANFQNFYTYQKILGKGTFAKVILCTRNSDNKKFAVKLFDKKAMLNSANSQKIIKGLRNEIDILRDLSHPNVIKLYEVYEGKAHLYLVMELLTGGELFKAITKEDNFTESTVCKLMRNLLQALDYLHAKNIMHRDIKPENIIIRSIENDIDDIVLADFGLSEVVKSELLYVKCGTPGYVAPEILQNQPYNTQVDLFSAGVIMLTGFSAFHGDSYAELLSANKKGDIDFNFQWLNCTISKNAGDLLRKLLDKNPSTRITANSALNHAWFQEQPASPYVKLHNESMQKLVQEQYQLLKSTRPKEISESKQIIMNSPLMNGSPVKSYSPHTPQSPNDIISPQSIPDKKSHFAMMKNQESQTKQAIKEIILNPPSNHKTLKSLYKN